MVVLVAWLWMLVGPEGWDAYAGAVLGVSFGGLLACRLPLPRRAELSLVWCAMAGFMCALVPVADPTGPTGPAATSELLLAAMAFVFFVITFVAFFDAMREIARAAGSARLVDRWRSVQRWHLGGLGLLVLFGLASLPHKSPTGVIEGAWAVPFFVAIVVLLGAMVYAVVAHVGLLLHLRRSFGLRSLVRRGQLVLRDDAWSPAAAAPRFVYQCTPPPWESSTTLS